jgi:hypothetical protein
MNEVTRILSALEQGDPHAAEQLLPFVYDELRRLAAEKMAHEKAGQTLQATALVHEAYLRLAASPGRESGESGQHWNSRGHFFAAAAEAMRRILVERARSKRRVKRGGGAQRVELDASSRTPSRSSRPRSRSSGPRPPWACWPGAIRPGASTGPLHPRDPRRHWPSCARSRRSRRKITCAGSSRSARATLPSPSPISTGRSRCAIPRSAAASGRSHWRLAPVRFVSLGLRALETNLRAPWTGPTMGCPGWGPAAARRRAGSGSSGPRLAVISPPAFARSGKT